MAYFFKNIGKGLLVLSLALGALFATSCATKGKVLKPSAVTEAEKKRALKSFQAGVLLLYKDDQAALKKFDEAAAIDPSFYPAHYNAGIAAEALGKLDEAALRYQGCLEQNKEEASCLANLLLVKAKQNDLEKAHELSKQYLREFPEKAFALIASARLSLFEKNLEEAEKSARLAIELDDANVEALYIMARVFYEKKQYAAAKFVIKNALELAPSHGGLYLLLGHIEMAEGLSLDAPLNSYEAAARFEPTPEALESYGLLLLKRGRAKDAVPVLERLVQMRPNSERNFLHLGNAYLGQRQFEEALQAYNQVLVLNPDSKDVIFNLGILFFSLKPKDFSEMDRLKKAQAYFQSYLQQEGLSSERTKEVKDYLDILNQKIEDEEYAAQAEKEAAEEKARQESEIKSDHENKNEGEAEDIKPTGDEQESLPKEDENQEQPNDQESLPEPISMPALPIVPQGQEEIEQETAG
jgi:tetratricopeptide (TPR) repeat protein